MKWQDLRVGQRMATAFGTIALVVGVGVALTLQLAGQERRLADEVDQATQISVLAEQARYQVADATGWQALVIADVASFGPTKALDPSSYNMAGLIGDQKIIQDWLDGLDVDAATTKEQAAFAALDPAWEQFFSWNDKVMNLLAQGTQESYDQALDLVNNGEAGDAYTLIIGQADTIQESVEARLATLSAQQEALATRATLVRVAHGVVSLLLVIGVGIAMSRQVVGPSRKILDAAQALADGDLTHHIGLPGKGEIALAGQALDHAVATLRTLVSEIAQTVDGTAQVTGAMRQQAARSRRSRRRPGRPSRRSGGSRRSWPRSTTTS